jgi:hypothetical protein
VLIGRERTGALMVLAGALASARSAHAGKELRG